ncbi:uncharacterized protein LOC109602705 isoform X2 [Aethina tumida]|uniref:uncharacterized protein LOC109602705 isoform X2 n=1 Tax=Aethina tumida TaxID=116153 RepID=UPI002148DC70|nr:uncharacterized protein LOC109602705 isoform X2 [Aethina tumida]
MCLLFWFCRRFAWCGWRFVWFVCGPCVVCARYIEMSTTDEDQFNRQVYDAISTHLKGSNTLHIPEDNVPNILKELQIFTSTQEVSKMLQCAKRYNRNGASNDSITFGEFCLLIREMQNQTNPLQHRKTSQHKTNNKCLSNCQVFLGGSCNPTTWRADTAIPELEKQGISFYNPQVTMWAPELVAQEHDAKQAASLLLFVIDSQTRSTVGMIEVAYLVASGRCVVVVAQPFIKGQSIMGEVISDQEYVDLVNGQTCLLHLVKSRGVKIHSDLKSALQCTANFFKNASSSNTTPEDQITVKLTKLKREYDSYGGRMSVENISDVYRRLTKKEADQTQVRNYLSKSELNNGTMPFDRFLTVMAELDGCDMCTSDVWAKSTNNNSCDLATSRLECLNERPHENVETNSRPLEPTYDVFLGGDKSAIKWCDEIAIPRLKNQGISYYNPTIREGFRQNGTSNFTSWDVMDGWKQGMDRSRILLFVITGDTRGLSTMVFASHYLAVRPENVILCIQHLSVDGCNIDNEMLTKIAIKDYNRARVYLADLAKRKQVKVFTNITDAVQEAIERSKSGK